MKKIMRTVLTVISVILMLTAVACTPFESDKDVRITPDNITETAQVLAQTIDEDVSAEIIPQSAEEAPTDDTEAEEEILITVYAPDGRELVINSTDLEAYKNVGWYATKEETIRTVYAPDGRELVVNLADVEVYENVGWYATKEEVIRTVYAPDGRELVVNLADVEAYKNVGWYATKEEVIRTMYAPDGRELVVNLADVEAYKNVGWYENKSDVQKTLFSYDGREVTVFLDEVEAYKSVGWYDVPRGVRVLDPTIPMVALTFDDGPKSATTPILLDILEAYGVKATFFVQGVFAKGNTDILARMHSMGCQIGSHTLDHPQLTTVSDSAVAYQLEALDEIVKSVTGKAPTTLRPPYGAHNERVREIAARPLILWSVDTLDWKYRDAAYVSEYVVSSAFDGAVILLHDIHPTTVEAAWSYIPGLLNSGYQLVTIDELAYYKGYTLEAGGVYSVFK
ncbi:MAG: polysaccharide deacetylase family protein [Clostridia bacterium]|nr:polysaccharide deacetylase family protein [Clostridia bacterium]